MMITKTSKTLAVMVLALSGTVLAGCLTTDPFNRPFGTDIESPDTPPAIASLGRKAAKGDRQAQLALGIAYERGCQVVQNHKTALLFYRLAATTSGGPIFVYVPGFNGKPGRTQRVGEIPVVSGLEEARMRRDLLLGKDNKRTRWVDKAELAREDDDLCQLAKSSPMIDFNNDIYSERR